MMRRLTDFNPKRGLMRLALRLPIWLYRARLGWLLGERFLLLTTSDAGQGCHTRTFLRSFVTTARPAPSS
jgi:hypothetical protein